MKFSINHIITTALVIFTSTQITAASPIAAPCGVIIESGPDCTWYVSFPYAFAAIVLIGSVAVVALEGTLSARHSCPDVPCLYAHVDISPRQCTLRFPTKIENEVII